MPKLPNFKKKEDIPAVILDLYEEKEGEWVPKPDEEAEDTTALKTALEKERKARKDAEKAAKDAEKSAADKKKDDDLRSKGLTDEQLKKIREEVRADVEKEYAPTKEAAEKLKKENRTLRLDNAVKTVMSKKEVGVRADRLDTLWKLVGEDFDLTDDGQPMVKDKPGTTVEKYLMDTVKKTFPEFYVGTQAAGGGAKGDHSPAPTNGSPKVEDILANPAQAMRQAREAGIKQ